jgi:integrase
MSASSIKPRKERQRGKVSWVVSLGKKFTGTKRQKKYFRTQKAASKFIEQSEKAREKLGEEAFVLPLEFRAEAVACLKLLKPYGVSLTDAVSFFLNKRRTPGAQKTVEQVKQEFIKSRLAMNCRPRTIGMYESHLGTFCRDLGKHPISQLQRFQIADWLEDSDWSPRTRKNYLTSVSALLNFALKREYLTKNPAVHIERPILEELTPTILTLAQVKSLLKAGLSQNSKILPAICIALFAGLRRSELCALEWSEIDLVNSRILIPASKAKTRRVRYVTISRNLKEWIETAPQKTGSVVPTSSTDVFGEHLRKLAKAAGINPWPRNALRHTFGSYFFGLTKDESRAAAEMGNSPTILFQHYRALVKQEEIEDFWSISPRSITDD